jgi:hypothetical protein
MIKLGKLGFAFFLLCSSSAVAYDQQYQPGDTGPNGGTITSVTVTSVDGNPIVTTNGDQQTTTIETTYTESIIEATTNQVVTTQITEVETRQVSGTNTTNNILNDIDPTHSGDVYNYGSSDSVSDTMLIFGPNGGTTTTQFNLNSYMNEEQWQGGFDIDTQADMLNCFNTQTTYSCGSSTGGPADEFTMTITVTDGSETYQNVTTHNINNGPTSYQSYSASLTVPENTLNSSATATIQGYGIDKGNYDLSDGVRGDGKPTYLGPLVKNPSVTITHNLYQTVIQQIEQQITNTITEYITTQLTDTETASTTITIETEQETTGESNQSTDVVIEQPVEETETIEIEIVIDTTETTSNDAITTVEDSNISEETTKEKIENTVDEVVETVTETIVDIIENHDDNNNSSDLLPPSQEDETEIVIMPIEEDPVITRQPKITQDHIDNMLDTIEVAVSDSVGDIVNMSVDITVDTTGTVQVEIVSVDMAAPMTEMAPAMSETVSVNDMNVAPPAMEAPSMDQMPDMPQMNMAPEPGTNLASNIDMPDASAPVDMPDMNAGPQDMASAVSEAVSEMANLDATPMEMAPPEPMSPETSSSPQSGDLVVGDSNDSPAPMEVEAAPQQQTAEAEAQPQQPESQSEPQSDTQPEPQSQSEPEPQQEATSEPEPEQTAEAEPQQQESEPEPEQTAEAQPEQESEQESSSEPKQQSEQESSQESDDTEPQEQETASNESKNDSKDSEQKTEQKAESKQTKTKTAEQKKQEMKQKIAQKILTRVLQNQNVTMAQVDATRLTLMTSLADTAGFNSYQSAILQDRTSWYTTTQIYDLPQMVDPFADILTGAQNMQMDSLIDSQYGD